MLPTKQRIVTKSAKVCIWFRMSGCVFVVLGKVLALFSNLKVSFIGQRSGKVHSLLHLY